MTQAQRATALSAYIDGIAVIGPGLPDWPTARAVLAGDAAYSPGPTALPVPVALPPAERRRTGRVVRLALALGLEATTRAGTDLESLLTVFTSSGGDGDNCHEICQTLASEDRSISPTRFHNSVHNAPAGYWSIATASMAASTAICAHDGSFAAGLIEALALVTVERRTVMLVAYDTSYPAPLHAKRPILDAFGVALVLAPARGASCVARLEARLERSAVDCLQDAALEALRLGAPAARSLPLLARLARADWGISQLDYLPPASLWTEVSPC